jgi:tetratricopeptide (TPR) repeat protein
MEKKKTDIVKTPSELINNSRAEIQAAKNALQENDDRSRDVFTMTIYRIIGRAKFMVIAQEAFEAIRCYDWIDQFIFNRYIYVSGRLKDFAETKKTFDYVVKQNLACSQTYSSYITAAGINKNFEEAKKAFNMALKENLICAFTYAEYIHAASSTGEFEEAKRAYAEASEKGLIDTNVESAYINALEVAGYIKEARDKAYALSQAGKTLCIEYFSNINPIINIDSPLNYRHRIQHRDNLQQPEDQQINANVQPFLPINTTSPQVGNPPTWNQPAGNTTVLNHQSVRFFYRLDNPQLNQQTEQDNYPRPLFSGVNSHAI